MRSERQLLDEIRLREASLDDAARERAAGELTDEDFAAITAREHEALRSAREELTALVSREASVAASKDIGGVSPGVRRRPRGWLYLALGCFAVAAGVLVWSNVGLRQAGTSATGGITVSHAQKIQQLLAEGEADLATSNDVAALAAYQEILSLAPTNVVALTETGWLDFTAGSASKNAAVVARGIAHLREAVSLAPSSPAPRLYYAIVAAATPGNAALARREFTVFLTLHPSAAQRAIAAPFVAKLGLSG